MAYGASLHFNPLTDTLPLPNGGTFRFSPPTGNVWPERGYERTLEHYQAPRDDGSDVELELNQKSERIQLIQAFAGWNEEDRQEVEMLIKVKGKCSKSLAQSLTRLRLTVEAQRQTIFLLLGLGTSTVDTWKTSQASHLKVRIIPPVD